MADTKITALTSISTSTDPVTDVLPIVDTTDFTMSGSGTTKKVTLNQLLGAGGTASLGTLTVTGTSTLTGAATVQGLTVGKGAGAIASNTAFGISALAVVTAASNCTAVGNSALLTVGTGTRNTAVGAEALKLVNTGGSNTGVGLGSLRDVTGSTNTGIGDISLYQLASGNSNTACGYGAGQNQTAGSNNAFFGANSFADDPIGSFQFNYGDGGVATHKFRAGDIVVGTGNVVMSTAAKGIDFSATANSSGTMTSELLNDYEEGTWVPTDSSGAGLAITGTACKYTKIGRAVTIQGIINYPTTANTSAGRFAGIPFAFPDYANMCISYIGSGGSTVAYLIGSAAGDLEFYALLGGSIQNAVLSGLSIRFFGTYTV